MNTHRQNHHTGSNASSNTHAHRFEFPEKSHIKAIHEVLDKYDFLKGRMEIHMPYTRTKQILSGQKVWLWPKFDKRPTSYLIFIDGWPPCLWSPDRQEGVIFKMILPSSLTAYGPCVMLANLLKGESVLQIEDIIIHGGMNLWTSKIFSERWSELLLTWNTIPTNQPFLSFSTRLVKPWTLNEWATNYDPSLSYIIQPDFSNQARWFWRDTVTPMNVKNYIAPTIKRFPGVPQQVVALCKPHKSALVLPDIYSLFSQEGNDLGIGAVLGMELSKSLRELLGNNVTKEIPVEVQWSSEFNKFKILRIMPEGTTISPYNTFLAVQQNNRKD
jgi:hypothetical protein